MLERYQNQLVAPETELPFAALAPPFETFVGCVQYWSDRVPHDTAILYTFDGEEDVRWTYGELEERSRAIAARLIELGAGGQPVLLLYPPGLEFVSAFFGCLFAGAIAVPAYPPRRNRSDERIETICRDARAGHVLTIQDTVARVREMEIEDVSCVATDELPRELAEEWKMPSLSIDSLAVLQYTSGSTGSPKGVVLTHGNLLHNCASISHGFAPTRSGSGLTWLPTFHDMGLVGGVLKPIFMGRPNLLMSPMAFLQEPIRWLRGITRYRVTISGGPNFGYALCNDRIREEDCEGLDLSSWEVAFNGAEPIRPETLERFTEKFAPYGFRAAAHYPCYGMAESTLIITGGLKTEYPTVRSFSAQGLENHRAEAPAEGERVARLVSCGRVLPGMRVLVVDPDRCEPLPESRVGEIWVSGPSVGRGYWQKPAETDRTFRARLAGDYGEEYLRTGDLGFFSEGELFISGRCKDVIIVRGRNLYPHDIELSVEDCHEALQPGAGAAFSVDSGAGESLVVAQEIKREFRRADLTPARDRIREVIWDNHEVTADAIAFVSPGRLPKTSSGKVSRTACRRQFLEGTLATLEIWSRGGGVRAGGGEDRAAVATTAPTVPEIQTWVAGAVARHMQLDPVEVDIHAPFARFGIDSVALVGISGELQTWLGHEVSPTLLFSFPTIAALAEHLGESAGTAPTVKRRKTARREFAEEQKSLGDDPIAIVGIGCRFPGAPDPDAYWELLRGGRHAIREIARDRWDVDAYFSADPEAPGKSYCRHAGLLEHIDQFDARFFEIAPREAERIDPQQRMLLEVSWETLENAGQAPDRLSGSQTGVFFGISNCEYERLQSRVVGLSGVDIHTGTGSLNSIAAGRVAYTLGLHGPCLVVDTACSSSLVAIHLAIESLRKGECGAALAGGVNAILDPTAMVAMCKMRALSHQGLCRTFDEEADGYVRGEGCGMVLLKRFSDALQQGDRVLGLIRGSALNHDGRSNGLTAPHGPSQEAVIRAALDSARLDPSAVTYLETHGSATPLGDPIEVLAAAAVYGAGRPMNSPLAIGSVKTNLGHLEAAAGIAGLLKVVLALQHAEIPPHLHLQTPNSHIAWNRLPLVVPTAPTVFPTVDGRRLAGVSAFGLSGTNAHLILEAAPPVPPVTPRRERPKHLLTLSAKGTPALQRLAGRYHQQLTELPAELPDLCFTANTGRTALPQRIAIVAENAQQAATQLQAYSQGLPAAEVVGGACDGQQSPTVAFMFPGEGSLFAGAGRQLYESQPTFRRAMLACAELLDAELDRRVLDELYPPTDTPAGQPPAAVSVPAEFALQYALSQLWSRWGVIPQIVVGHGVGEFAAACLAGVFGLEDAVKLVAGYTRATAGAGSRTHVPFEPLCRGISFSPPHKKFVSYRAGGAVDGTVATPDYWLQHVGQRQRETAVTLSDGIGRADIFLAMGPLKDVDDAVIQEGRQGDVLKLSGLRSDRDDWSVLLDTAAQLFVRGVPIDWDGFDSDYARRKIAAPTYPFQRERYWIETAGGPAEGIHEQRVSDVAFGPTQDWYYEVEWQPRSRLSAAAPRDNSWLPEPADVARQLQPDVERLEEQLNLPRYQDLPVEMDGLAAGYARKALRRLGWRMTPGESITVADLAERLGIGSGYHRLLGQLLRILEADGLLAASATGWKVGRQRARRPDPELLRKSLAERLPECEAELALLKRCGEQLSGVLTGEVDPLEILFPSGSGELVERLYRDSPFARTLNTIVEEAFVQLIHQLPPDHTLRILEIGAGVGSTTSHILPRLPKNRTEYLFTDVTEVFTQSARPKFRQFPFVRFGALDIEIDPRQQGYADGQFDVILASNVFHATKDLRDTVRHTRQLLAPHGFLVLLEGTRPQYWMDLIFGLTEGWWRYTDTDLRREHPMLSARQWIDLLAGSGFRRTLALPEPDDRPAAQQSPYAVVVAQSDQTAQAATRIAPTHRPAAESTVWMILADDSEIGQELAGILSGHGQECILVEGGDAFAQVREDRFVADPTSVADLTSVVQSIRGRELALRGVVHLASLDAPPTDELTLDGLAAAQQLGCVSAAAVLQALQSAELSHTPQVWFVTRGAQRVAAGDEISGLSQSPLWGFGRVVSEESPAFWGGLVDLDPQAPARDAALRIADELLEPDGEDQVAYRNGQRFAPRLSRRGTKTEDQPLPWRADASYLVSGGLGDLGLQVARWIATQGGRHVVLFGRTQFPNRSDWDAAAASDPQQAAQIALLREIEAAGASVRIAAVDVGDEIAMSTFLSQLREDGWPPIRGLVHCAGVAEAAPLFDLDRRGIERVLRPKVLGGWLLHRLLQTERLDFFVNFSSGASLLGSPLLGSYAAANTFLDAMAHYRRSQGLPALSINWGFWSQAGMVARTQREIGQGFAPQGMQSYTPAQGLAAMQQLLREGATQASVMPVDWQQWRSFHPRASQSPLLAGLMLTETDGVDDAQSEAAALAITRGDVLAAPLAEREQLLKDYIAGQLARVLRTAPQDLDVELPLSYLGIDSLMAVEMRNRIQSDLEATIPVALLLQQPTIAQLAAQLLCQLQPGQETREPALSRGPSPDPPAAMEGRQESALDALEKVADLSDDQVTAMLNELLNDQKQKE